MTPRACILAIIALLTLALGQRALFAQAPFAPSISWWAVAGGGGTLSSGPYQLSGTVGQANASTALSGGTFRLAGGYWGEQRTTAGKQVWLPVVQR